MGIARCTTNIALGFDIGIRVDIRDNGNARILFAQIANIFRGNARGQRTARNARGQEHGFVGIENFCGLGHKAHTAKNNGIGVGFCGFTR